MKISLRAYEADTLLDHMPEGVTTLSLDCFDTLLWRGVHGPADVFTGIDMPGGGVKPRQQAEVGARLAAANKGIYETNFDDIYRCFMPDGDDAAIEAAIQHEMTLESQACFAFAPVVRLMRAAKERGLQLIIVSDMYMSEAQLRWLLAETAGPDVIGLVDRVFMSSAYGAGKSGTLFTSVMDELGLAPQQILHMGDNPRADYQRPDELGIHVAHLVQFDEGTVQRLRLEANASLLIDPTTRITQPVPQPQRAQIAMRREDDPAYALGYDVIGSMLHAFARWTKEELDAMSAELGKPVRPLFLMRDGHMPMLAFNQLYPEAGGAPVELSRVIAIRSSLFTEQRVADYLKASVNGHLADRMRRQMMITKAEYAGFGCDGEDVAEDQRRFVAGLHRPGMMAKIAERSRRFGDKLAAHLAKAGVQPGDAVMLVDLGYNGTVQNMVEPFLRERMGLQVAGRYLLLREFDRRKSDKKGLLDVRHYEYRVLDSLARCVGFLELLMTNGSGSTVDLTAKGEPIRQAPDSKARQSRVRERVQEAALAYVAAEGEAVHGIVRSDTPDSRRRMVAANLARLFFFPNGDEADLFATFDFDFNMGARGTMKLFDPEEAATMMRRRGLSYVTEAHRIYVPAEIQPYGLQANLTYLASMRYSLDLKNGDFSVGGTKVSAILVSAEGQAIRAFDAYPTAEGFYTMRVPVGAGKFTVAVQLGQHYEWVQIEHARFVSLHEQVFRRDKTEGFEAVTVADGMTQNAPGLYSAEPHGVLIAMPPRSSEPQFLELCFRPIRLRGGAVAGAEAIKAA